MRLLKFITGHVTYNPAYTYKFKLKTTKHLLIHVLLSLALFNISRYFSFAPNFHPWEFLLIKRLEIEKTKITQYTTFETDIIKVVLGFSISNFFNNKNPMEGN